MHTLKFESSARISIDFGKFFSKLNGLTNEIYTTSQGLQLESGNLDGLESRRKSEVKELRCHVPGGERQVKSKNTARELTRGPRTWSETIHIPATL